MVVLKTTMNTSLIWVLELEPYDELKDRICWSQLLQFGTILLKSVSCETHFHKYMVD